MREISTKRNLNLEWLRVLSMIMIIFLHSIDHSGVYEALVPGTIIYNYEQFTFSLVQVCVNCFVLISGYFLVNSTFKLKKLMLLWLEVVFYALSIKLILMGTGAIPVSSVSLISCFFPVLTGRYWFVTIYFGMYLIFPFLNIWIRAMTRKQHGLLLLLLFVLASCMVSVHPSLQGMNSGGGWGLAWFVVLYLTAAYLRLYGTPLKTCWKPLLVFFICPFVTTLALLAANIIGSEVLFRIADNWRRYDSAPVYLASVALMIAFLNMKQNCTGIIQRGIIRISSTTFGIYLLHSHANLCTEEMWQRIGIVSNLAHWWFPLYQLLIVAIIFALCSLLDLLRQYVFKTIRINKLAETIADRLDALILHNLGEKQR